MIILQLGVLGILQIFAFFLICLRLAVHALLHTLSTARRHAYICEMMMSTNLPQNYKFHHLESKMVTNKFHF